MAGLGTGSKSGPIRAAKSALAIALALLWRTAPRRASRIRVAQSVFVVASLVVLLVYAIPQVVASRDPFRWDLMFITGMLTLLAGLLAAGGFERRVESTLLRLADRGAIAGDRDPSALIRTVQDRAERTGVAAGSVLAVVVLIALVAAPGRHHVVLHTLGAVGGFFVGYHLGRFASYGRIGHHLRREGVDVRVLPRHPDGVAGLRPVGELYFRQAMLAAVPAAFLAAWSIVLPAWPEAAPYAYSEWRYPYLGLLAIAIAGVAGAFLAPMWSFHRIMAREKEQLIRTADQSSQRIVELRAVLAETSDDRKRDELAEEIRHRLEEYAAIEGMPTWPIDPVTKRRFLNRNLLLAALPIAGNVAGISEEWRGLLAALAGA